MGYLGNQITTVFPTSISVDSATINGNTDINGDTAKLTLTDTSSHSANTGPEVSFFSKDSGGTSREVAKIVGESHSGSNEGNLAFQTRNGGTLETKWKIFKNGNMLPSNSAYGIYLGTTSVADGNLLDDYEEGSWTPNVTGGLSYGFQYGHYIKVGKMVFASFDIDMDSIAASTNRLHGLPFSSATSTDTNAPFGVVHIGYYSAITTGVHWLSGYVQAGNASIYFTGNSQSGQTIQHNTFNVFNDTTRILGYITYVSG